MSLQLIKTEACNPGADIAGGGGGHATLGACIDVIVILNFASEVTYPLQPLAQSKPKTHLMILVALMIVQQGAEDSSLSLGNKQFHTSSIKLLSVFNFSYKLSMYNL